MNIEKIKIKVLDRGFVRLIDHMGSDLMIVNSARVSFSKESFWSFSEELNEDGLGSYLVAELSAKDKKLISYLAKNNHWTPFAHPQICLHIKAPFPIRTQFFKHKIGFVENEVSRRYVDDEPEFFYPTWSSRPDGSIKQGAGSKLEDDKYSSAHIAYSEGIDHANRTYKTLIEMGVAPEQARFVLPLGAYTEWYWTGSLSAYARFYKQRSDSHAQAEIREYAEAIGQIIKDIFPVSWEALSCQ